MNSIAVIVVILGLALSVMGCSPLARKVEVDVGRLGADVLCLINQEDLSDEELKKVCGLTDEDFKSFRARRAEAEKRQAELRKPAR